MNQLITLLKDARGKRGLSQEEAGKLIGISQRAYAFYEDGTRTPKWPRLKELGKALGIDEAKLWIAFTGNSETFVSNDGNDEESNEDGELTHGQILSFLARSLERYSKAHEHQAETIRIQASILEEIQKRMARESSLQEVLAGVETIADRQGPAIQKILADLAELKGRGSNPS